MRLIRRSVLGAAAAISVAAVAAPTAGAQTAGWGWGTPVAVVGQWNLAAGCQANFPAGVGFSGGTTANTCATGTMGLGAAIGEIANVTGPVVTGTAVLEPIVVTAGPASY
jgi:hypothetical protein